MLRLAMALCLLASMVCVVGFWYNHRISKKYDELTRHLGILATRVGTLAWIFVGLGLVFAMDTSVAVQRLVAAWPIPALLLAAAVLGTGIWLVRRKPRRKPCLSAAQMAAIGAALKRIEAEQPGRPEAAALRLLLLTGWRAEEVVALRWTDFDLPQRVLYLTRDRRDRPGKRVLPKRVLKLLDTLPRSGPELFPTLAANDGALLHGFWAQLCLEAGAPRRGGLGLLRDSYIYTAADSSFGNGSVAAMIGHATSRLEISRKGEPVRDFLAPADRMAEVMVGKF